MSTIEPGMLVECIHEKWDAATLIRDPSPPQFGSRWAVIGVDEIASLPPSPVKFLYLSLRHKPVGILYLASFFKPVDGEFERLKKLVEKIEVYDLGGIQVPRYPVDA